MTTRHTTGYTRRNFLTGITGAVIALPLVTCRSPKPLKSFAQNLEAQGDYLWSGIGFGIEMSMELYGVTTTEGDQLAEKCEQCIGDLERAFSLYLEDSELSILNRDRLLRQPSPVFRKLIKKARHLQARTLGYFEPAVHGTCLWLEKHRSASLLGGDSGWPEQCTAANFKYVKTGVDGSMRLTNPLTMLSMNAIGQGFLADTVATHLRAAGVNSALLHLGETYAIGKHPEGRLWKLAVTGTPTRGESEMVGVIDFADAGLAISAQDAIRLMIDPVAHKARHEERVVAIVSAEGASVADAYATAFAVSPVEQWPRLACTLKQTGSQVHVWIENQLKFKDV